MRLTGLRLIVIDTYINRLPAKLSHFNLYSLEVVSYYRDPELQVGTIITRICLT